MKQVINLSNLLGKKRLTSSEFEKFFAVSEKNIPHFRSDIVAGVGWIFVNWGLYVLYMDRYDVMTPMRLQGLFNVILGFVLARNKTERILWATICFLMGTAQLFGRFALIPNMHQGWIYSFY